MIEIDKSFLNGAYLMIKENIPEIKFEIHNVHFNKYYNNLAIIYSFYNKGQRDKRYFSYVLDNKNINIDFPFSCNESFLGELSGDIYSLLDCFTLTVLEVVREEYDM